MKSKLSKSSIIQFFGLLALCVALQVAWDHSIEFLILVAFMYDIGFELRFVDELMSFNNKFNAWLHAKLDKKRRRKRRKASNVQQLV